MLARGRKGICEVSSEFKHFETFLDLLGPKKDPTETLDRIHSNDREYAPGKVRWATKSLQNRNRKNTIFLTYDGHKLDGLFGKTLTLNEWAELTNQVASTMRQRQSNGWTATENIEGRRKSGLVDFSRMAIDKLLDFKPWPDKAKIKCEELYLRRHREFADRFDFLIQELLPLNAEAKVEEGREIAFYLRNDEDLDQAFSAYNVSNMEPDPALPIRDKVWCPHPDVDLNDFEAFLHEYREVVEALKKKREAAKKDRERWLDALRSKRGKVNNRLVKDAREHLRRKHGL